MEVLCYNFTLSPIYYYYYYYYIEYHRSIYKNVNLSSKWFSYSPPLETCALDLSIKNVEIDLIWREKESQRLIPFDFHGREGVKIREDRSWKRIWCVPPSERKLVESMEPPPPLVTGTCNSLSRMFNSCVYHYLFPSHTVWKFFREKKVDRSHFRFRRFFFTFERKLKKNKIRFISRYKS